MSSMWMTIQEWAGAHELARTTWWPGEQLEGLAERAGRKEPCRFLGRIELSSKIGSWWALSC